MCDFQVLVGGLESDLMHLVCWLSTMCVVGRCGILAHFEDGWIALPLALLLLGCLLVHVGNGWYLSTHTVYVSWKVLLWCSRCRLGYGHMGKCFTQAVAILGHSLCSLGLLRDMLRFPLCSGYWANVHISKSSLYADTVYTTNYGSTAFIHMCTSSSRRVCGLYSTNLWRKVGWRLILTKENCPCHFCSKTSNSLLPSSISC